jgi:hypothetical protein
MDYVIGANVLPAEIKLWGDFVLRKSYSVTLRGTKRGVFGYIIQYVVKTTDAEMRDPPKKFTTTKDIETLTSNNVRYATHSYYELFPILNGVGSEDDEFANGAILTYLPADDTHPDPEADDDPPTKGIISMIGTSVFVPTPSAVARSIAKAIESPPNSLVVRVGGLDWSLDTTYPAAGLPYRTDFMMPSGNKLVHTVIVKWDYDGATDVSSMLDTLVDAPASVPVGGSRRTKRTSLGRTASKSRYRPRTGRTTRRSRGRA